MPGPDVRLQPPADFLIIFSRENDHERGWPLRSVQFSHASCIMQQCKSTVAW